MKCIECDKAFYMDDLSTVDQFVYRCEATKELIVSVDSEGCSKAFRTKGPNDN